MLLRSCSASCTWVTANKLLIEDFTTDEVKYHLNLLLEAGFIDANKPLAIYGMYIRGITFLGHDYLDAVRQPKIWQKTKDLASKAGVTMTISLAKELAVKVSKDIVLPNLL